MSDTSHHTTPLPLAAMTAYAEGAVVSRTILDKKAGTLTLFAFAEGQGLSEHTAPYDATVQVLDGEGVFTVGGVKHVVRTGEALIMPANVPHEVRARTPFKMLLIMIRG
jgi:quercetin dioxygenase-like cupin family protein